MAKKEESYEALFDKLQLIVEEMESSELSLDDAVKKYEEGIKLSSKLNELLSKTEGKIKLLKDGVEQDFNSEGV